MSAAQRVVVEADGGSRGNPGPAGYGAVVFSADRSEVLAERREALGIATNNVAEYRGLIAALTAAADAAMEGTPPRTSKAIAATAGRQSPWHFSRGP